MIVGPPRSSELPTPICSQCKLATKIGTNTAEEGQLTLSLVYKDDIFEDFVGNIKVAVILSDDTTYIEVIDDVKLSAGEKVLWELPNPARLSWLDVEHVEVELAMAS